MHTRKRLSALIAAALLGVVGCQGSKGTAGTNGTDAGGDGPGGLGAITVHVDFTKVNGSAIATALPAPGVYCFTNPDFTTNSSDTVADATTDANGDATFDVAGGWYKFQCRGGADYADDMALTAATSVAAGGTATVKVVANRINPLYFTTAPSVSSAAINGTGTVSVGATSVSGATFTVTPVAKKSLVDVTVDATAHTFTVPEVDQVLANLDSGTTDSPATVTSKGVTYTGGRGLWKAFHLPLTPGFVSLGDGVARSLAKALYFDVTASDGTHTTTVHVVGKITGLQDIQGGQNTTTKTGSAYSNERRAVGPIGVLVIGSDKVASTYVWTLTGVGTDFTTALTGLTLNGAATRNPYFTPTVEGVYTLTNSVSGTVLKYNAAKYLGLFVAGADFKTSAGVCGGCHNSYVQSLGYADIGDYWAHAMGVHGNTNYFSDETSRLTGSKKAETILQWGLQGIDYSTTCYRCHSTGATYVNTTGMEATVDNGGFEAELVKLDNGGTYASTETTTTNLAWVGDGEDHWTGLDGGLKALAGIQCESCHGPASVHVLKTTDNATDANPQGVIRPWGVATCAVCHDAPGHHDKVELWSQSLHNNAIAVRGEVSSSAPTTPTSCERCHTAQGFAAMVTNIKRYGTADYQNLGTGGASLPILASGTAEPQTCSACHEPHTTELRLDDAVAVAPNGISYSGVGAGAVCLGCHVVISADPTSGGALLNTSLDPGSVLNPNNASATAGTPHHGPQGDVLFGTNAYFVDATTSYIGKHAAVTDTCVGCHVQLVPDTVSTANDNHTFRADNTICKNCHGATVTGEAIQAAVESKLTTLQNHLAAGLLAQLTAQATAGYTIKTALDTGAVIFQTTAAPTAVAFNSIEFHGQPTFDVTVGGTKYNTVVTQLYKGQVPAPVATTPIVTSKVLNWYKAFYNWNLVEADKSKGIHNPTFVNAILDKTIAADLSL